MAATGALRATGRAAWHQARRRYPWLDHAARAALRYAEQRADRLAAALAYYAFFAAFAVSGLGFAVLGWMLRGDEAASLVAQRWVGRNLPWIDVPALVQASAQVGLIALAGLLVAGLAWVRGLRSAVRTVWRLHASPEPLPIRLAIDVGVLIGFCGLILLSVAITVAVSGVVRWLVSDAVGADAGSTRLAVSGVGYLLGLAVNVLLAVVLLTGLPRIRMPARRVLGPAVVVAAGLEGLKTLGRMIFEHSTSNPVYQAVASAVGLLLFLNLLNQVVLYAAALTATSRYGEVVDLASDARL